MNRLVLFCCVFFSLQNTFSQTNIYHPFPHSGALWNVRISGSNQCHTCYIRSYWISGDTSINGSTYHKINYSQAVGIMIPPWWSCFYSSSPSGNYYAGALREDTIQRQVYFVPNGNSSDTLLYDFSLGVGDTIPNYDNYFGSVLTIASIDSVLIGYNYRKRFNLDNSLAVLIEGIGSTSGLIEDIWVFECGGYLECYSENNQTLYPDTSSQCEIISSKPELKSNQCKIIITPNPFHTTARLERSPVNYQYEMSELRNSQMRIYSTLGVLVREEKILNLNSFFLHRNGMNDGMYFYELRTTDSELINTGKFIVE